LLLSALTLGELQAGAEVTRKKDAEKAAAIESWIGQVAAGYEVIPMDAGMFREWARMIAGKSDQLIEDAMIAATARVRGLVVVTRNVRDFEAFDVKVVNPFKAG
jgi:predicted nucleic acid-binding protein